MIFLRKQIKSNKNPVTCFVHKRVYKNYTTEKKVSINMNVANTAGTSCSRLKLLRYRGVKPVVL